MTRAPHVDHLHVHDIDGDGRPELLMVAGKDLVVLDAATGEDRWIFEGTHIQTCAVGNFQPEREAKQLFLTERRLHGEKGHIGFRGYMVDCRGNEIWRMEKAGYGRTIQLADHEADVIFAECQGKKPMLIDGHGKIIQELDMPLRTYAEDRFDDGDTGVRAVFTIADTNGDGKLELLGYNRTRLWHWVQD